MDNWFGTFDPRTKQLKTVTKLFDDEIVAIRDQFLTVKKGPGYHTSDTWRPITTQNVKYYMCVASINFLNVVYVDNYWTPVLTMTIKIATQGGPSDPLQKVYDGNGAHQLHLKDYFSHPVRVEYHPNFPSVPPRVRVERPDYIHMTGDHDHHILYHGWICYFRDGEGWNPDVSTTLTGLNEAVGWMIRHYKKFRW